MKRYVDLISRSVLAIALVLTVSTPGAHAQTATSVTQANTGIQHYQGYDGTREDINLGTGSLHVTIPLISLPERGGHNLDIGIEYDSQNFNLEILPTPPSGSVTFWNMVERNTSIDASQLGWRLTLPYLSSTTVNTYIPPDNSYQYNTNYTLTLPDGSTHHFSNVGACVGNSAPCGTGNSTMQGYSPDYDTIYLDTTSSTTAVAVTRDGTRYTFSIYGGIPTSIEDTNGNLITINGAGPTSISDNSGRTITFNYSSTQLSSIQSKDSNGHMQSYNFNYSPYALAPTFVEPTSNWRNLNGEPPTEILGSVVLPTGRAFGFSYNGFGELTQISYPSGGYTGYKFATFEASIPNYSEVDVRELVEKDVCRSASGSCSVTDMTTYTPTVSYVGLQPYSFANNTMTVLDPLKNQTITTFTVSGPNGAVPLSVEQYQGKTTPLKTVSYVYTPGISCSGCQPYALGAGLPTQITTTLDDTNQVSKVNYTYDTFSLSGINGSTYTVNIPNQLTISEYGYGNGSPGGLIRTTTNTWLKSPAYQSANIIDRKYSEIITDGTGNTVSQTQMEYDNYTAGISPSGAAQHDPSREQSYIVRGNVTATKRWRNTDGAWLVTRNQYDDAGNIVSITAPSNAPFDSFNRTATYSYGDSWSNSACAPISGIAAAYPTKVTNAAGQIMRYTYNSCSGTVGSSTDLNLHPTTFTYDIMNRRVGTNYPDSGQTSVCFSDDPGSSCYSGSAPLSAVTTSKITASTNKVSTIIQDGLGRQSESQINSDPDCTASGGTKVDTTYDGLERTSSISNPYCSTSDLTYALTTYQYDALNRPLIQTNSGDGSYLQWTYTGNLTDVYDENKNHWQRTIDALGRVSKVLEPDPASNIPTLETDYVYDALNNLCHVDQWGGTAGIGSMSCGATGPAGDEYRNFGYDSLSRLTSATNPESGTITYAYDSDSNVHAKTDARGITTTYSYDALNRVTGKTYSDTTYPVTYTYDTSSGPNPLNTVGRLTDEKTSVQGETVTERAIDQYDQMGRPLSERQCFLGGCSGTAYTLTHSYDLSGDVSGSNNGLTGSNVASFVYGYDAAGRLNCVTTSGLNCTQPGTLFQAEQFSAIGLTQAEYGLSGGSTPAFSQTLTYDNRKRLTSESEETATLSPIYSFAVGYDFASNVVGLTDSQMGSWTYTPDHLNRLLTATSTAGVYSGLTLTETYDAFGNRKSQTASGTFGGTVPQPNPVTFTQNNNRVDQWQYDAAGEVQSDGTNMYEYDAEGHQTGTLNSLTGLTGYVYDAEGRRVEKIVVNGFGGSNPTTTVEDEYLLGLNGEQVSVLDGSGTWKWTNVYAGGRQLATYDNAGTHFALTDWLGTKRVELNVTAPSTVAIGEQCLSLPYGDGLDCTGIDINQLHYTGKQRDIESNNDYFDARYYASNVAGRFLTPDWSAKTEPVPYAKMDDPQTLNLYAYVRNNPLNMVDADGHVGGGDPTTYIQFAMGYIYNEIKGLQYRKKSMSKVDANAMMQTSQAQQQSSNNTQIAQNQTPQQPSQAQQGQSPAPNPYVTTAAQVLDVTGTASGHPFVAATGSAISVANDPSLLNELMVGASVVPVVGEAFGAAAGIYDVGNVAGQWITNHIMAPMINAIPGNTTNDGNGHTVPTAEKTCEDYGMC